MLKTVGAFKILQPEVAGAQVRLHYAFTQGVDEVYRFVETYDFGREIPALAGARGAAFDAALKALAVCAGISYYKAFCPPEIVVEWPLHAGQAAFFSGFYAHGLGEFAARGGHDILALTEKVRFAGAGEPEEVAAAAGLAARSLVMVGGGKDSLVTIEALRHSGHDVTLMAIKVAKPIADCMDASGLPQLRVTRALDPMLFDLNAQGALNGHVPITGILSWAAAVGAIAFDYDAVVFSNERSASEATAVYQGVAVNHQYSKSLEAEMGLRDYVRRYVASDLRVFSFLRPLSEMQIAALFAEETRYDDVFTSCNKAYAINKTAEARWCCDCPKCRFVFLALATAMEQERLVGIFGKNMLEDATQADGFAALCGLADQKPWECVGEVSEAAGAVGRLAAMPEWRDAVVVKTLLPRLEALYGDLQQAWGEAMTVHEVEGFPRDFLKALALALEGHKHG